MESPRSMLRIFVDDASVDLHAHRHAARRLIEKFDEHAVVMEDFGAQDTGAVTVSLARLKSCSVHILLLAWRDALSHPQSRIWSIARLETPECRG